MIPVGIARMDITPQEPIRLAGYASRSAPSAGVAGPLSAKALAFGSDVAPAVLITTDLIGIPAGVGDSVARRLERVGVARPQLAITATHTHSGPAVGEILPYQFGKPLPPEEQRAVDRYTEQLISTLEQLALEALADRRPARIAHGKGSVGFAANRRELEDGKWARFGINPEGPVDHDLPVLTATAPDGTVRAVLLGYACHATTLDPGANLVHGDWPGEAARMVEQRHPGAVAMVLIGAGADANPAPRGGLPEVRQHATEIADEVDRVLRTPRRPIRVPPTGRFRWIDVPFDYVPTRRELEESVREDGPAGYYARTLLERLFRGEEIPRSAPYPIQTWSFGEELAMIFLGGEVVADYGLRLKRELDARRIWVTAYANDVAFYVASRRMIPEGGYEVDRSMVYYGQPSRLASPTEELIIRTVHDLLPAAFTPLRVRAPDP